MRQIVLQGTEISVSRLSFGTASLHHLISSRRRQDLLAAAFAQGFTHFDTAPSYGHGMAEEELGRFLASHRAEVTVATKVGLYPPVGSRANLISVWARKAAGRALRRWSVPVVDWSVRSASLSLDRSLRRLRTEQIDLLLLHEPFDGVPQQDEWLTWLQQERANGRIRTWGLAGPASPMRTLVSNTAIAPVLQVRDSWDRREADVVIDSGRELQLTYGYLSSTRAGGGQDAAMPALRNAMQRNPNGSILVSTRRIARVGQLASAAEASA